MNNFVSALKKFVEELNFKKIYSFFFCLYRVAFSLHFGGSCRFVPSCSAYAEKAFSSLPFFVACRLVFKRLIRCHSFSSSSGVDPVPDSSVEE